MQSGACSLFINVIEVFFFVSVVCCCFFFFSLLLFGSEKRRWRQGQYQMVYYCVQTTRFVYCVCLRLRGAVHPSALLHIASPFFYLTVDACTLFSRPLFLTTFKHSCAAFTPTNSLFQKFYFHECFFRGSRADTDREQFKVMNCSKITTTNLKHDAGAAASI